MRHAATLLLAALALSVSGEARAAERQWGVPSFVRLRVQAALDVRVTSGPPRARASGDPRLLERLSVEVNGDTLVVRLTAGDRAGLAGAGPVTVAISTPRLESIQLTAPGRVSAAALTGERVSLGVTGTGAASVEAVTARALDASVIGAGTITLAGRAGAVRLTANGPGLMDAGALTADEVTILLDGAGEVRADARYAARVTSTGLGTVAVSGNAKCTVRAAVGGNVRCGAAAP